MNKSVFKNKYDLSLGKTDKITNYQSKWDIYELDIFNKNGLWLKFKNILKILEDQSKFKNVSIEDINTFYNNFCDIEFEVSCFSNLMKNNYIFKINNILYSYTTGYKSKRKIYARFYFNFEKIIDLIDD